MILCMISSSWIYDITTLNVWYQRTYDIIGLWYHKQYHIMVLDHDIMHDIIILELWYHHPESMISGTYDIIDLWYHRQYYRFWTMISCMISYTCNLEVQELAQACVRFSAPRWFKEFWWPGCRLSLIKVLSSGVCKPSFWYKIRLEAGYL